MSMFIDKDYSNPTYVRPINNVFVKDSSQSV